MSPKLNPMKTLIAALTVLVGILLTACSTPGSRIRRDPSAFQRATPAEQELIKHGKVALGFDEAMVLLALGKPTRVREKTDSSGRSAIWSYFDYEPSYGYGRYAHGGWGEYGHGGWGAYGHGLHAYSPAYPYRSWRERARIVFREGQVIAIELER